MAIKYSQVALSTTAVELTAGFTLDSSAIQSVAVQAGATTVFIGDASVTAATGYPLRSGQSIALDLGYSERLYGILAAGTDTAYILRTHAS